MNRKFSALLLAALFLMLIMAGLAYAEGEEHFSITCSPIPRLATQLSN